MMRSDEPTLDAKSKFGSVSGGPYDGTSDAHEYPPVHPNTPFLTKRKWLIAIGSGAAVALCLGAFYIVMPRWW